MGLPDSDGISRVPPYSGSTWGRPCFRLRDCYPLRSIFPDGSANIVFPYRCPTTPAEAGLGSSRFARRYSGNRVYFLFLRVLRCFSSPGLPPHALLIHAWATSFRRWVSPFGHLRFTAYLQLPEAFRCWFRPSSALSAKASTVRSSSLNRNEFVSVLRRVQRVYFLNAFVLGFLRLF